MPRYIDADALKEKAYVMEYKDEWHMTKYGEFVELADVENAPTADVVEVVRCRDCKHRPIKGDGNIVYAPDDSDGWDDDTCPCLCEDCYYNWMPDDDFFCGKGERRNDG